MLGDALAGTSLGFPWFREHWLWRRRARMTWPGARRGPRYEPIRFGEEQVDRRQGFWNASLMRVAVRGWLRKWKTEGKTFEEVLAAGVADGEIIAFRSDLIMRKQKGAGEVFNAIARAIAVLSLHAGGVELFGLHFENDPATLEPSQ